MRIREPAIAVVAAACLAAALGADAGVIPTPVRAAPAVAARAVPPMGWNSWNSGIALSDKNIRATIDAMVASGMRDAGYRYVNLDAGWAAPTRDSQGNLRADPGRFPGGIAALAQYAHDRGMYLGLYSSPYNQVCGQTTRNASLGHEIADARTFAAWGVDYLKYDWCRNDADLGDQVRAFTAMRDALRASGRHIIYSINPHSSADPAADAGYDWSTVADMTRNNGDLIPLWQNTFFTVQTYGYSTSSYLGILDQLQAAAPLAARSRPGYWNDPDMLVVGVPIARFFGVQLSNTPDFALPDKLTPDQTRQLASGVPLTPDAIARLGDLQEGLTSDEQRSHFSLWAMLAAPLLAGNDVRAMTEQTRALLTNSEVVAIDQDALVAQATPLPGDDRVLTKPLADGALAVALINRGSLPTTIETSLTALGLRSRQCYQVRDLWAHAGGTTTDRVAGRDIPAHGVALLKLTRC
ncbi:glycoside hydrolase family 27 protein [Nocardia sp. NBC_01388]|uniref:glycoside hydrolase family 27 protein n=1 Tax=Nocardia sp. NBC_01388 TaxID=2903596 RepID=UPI003865858B